MIETAYTLGMGQMLVESGQPAANLARAVQMIREAARRDCRIVVLPECLDAGWTSPESRRLAQPIPGPHSEALAEAAREHRVYVAAGLTERWDDRVYNAAVLLSPLGGIVLKHRKINELDIGRQFYATGESLAVARTLLGVIGMNICADNFPESISLGDALGCMGAQLLVSPCAWAVEADHDNEREPYGDLWIASYSELARRHAMTVVGASNVGWLTAGPWKGRKCIGCSLAVGPDARVLARGPYGADASGLVTVPIEIARQRTAGAR